MANIMLNDANIVTRYSAEVVAQLEMMALWPGLIGKKGDINAFVHVPKDIFVNQKGKTARVPLSKATTDDAYLDGANLEGNEKVTVMSNTDITATERSMPFGGFSKFENLQGAMDLRDMSKQDAAAWAAQDLDKYMFSVADLAIGSLPTFAARGASQHNVEFIGDAANFDALPISAKATEAAIKKGKMYFRAGRGIRPGQIAPGIMGNILILPPGATYDLGQDGKFQEQLMLALPRSEDHVLFKGMGLNPWGYCDGVFIVEDNRPVYGGTNKTFLQTQDAGNYVQFEGIFLGAQGIGYKSFVDLDWVERLYNYEKKYGVAVSRTLGAAKLDINLGTKDVPSLRAYGVGYFCGSCTKWW